jgi:hypothetical protein
MADNDILKQIALLNPRIINGNDSINDFIISSDNSSPREENQDDFMEHHTTDEDNDILNLWSSTKIFFDPLDPSKINPTTQTETNQTLTEVHKLTEREIDRQRYERLKQQQQSIYINRGRHNMVDDGKGGTNHEVLHLSNLNDIQLRNILMNNKNRETEQAIEENLLQASTSNTTTHSIATSQGYMNNISTPINYQLTLDNKNAENNENKDLYSQLINTINNNNNNNVKKSNKESDAILSKTNDSRSKEIAEKKKRRSAATMRCRERKRNQLQKKEQYIKYLENQILFLNGSILHMSNEIHWLRRSFLDQYGEQSLKNIYMKNGFKDVNLSNIIYPGSSPSPSSFANSNYLSPSMSINGSPNLSAGQSPEQNKSSPLLPQQSPFLTPISSNDASNTNSLLSNYSPPPSSGSNVSKNTTTSSVTPQTIASLLQKNPHSNISSNMNANYIGSYNNPSHPTPSVQSSTADDKNASNATTANDLINHLDMETLNEFANLTKEQRDVLLKILEKQKELSNEKPEESSVPSVSSRNFINIDHDHESQSELSKPSNSLLNIVSSNSITPNSTASFHSLSSNLLNTINGQQNINNLSFNSSSMAMASSTSSVPVTSTNLLNTFNTQTTTEKETSANIITTTTDNQN